MRERVRDYAILLGVSAAPHPAEPGRTEPVGRGRGRERPGRPRDARGRHVDRPDLQLPTPHRQAGDALLAPAGELRRVRRQRVVGAAAVGARGVAGGAADLRTGPADVRPRHRAAGRRRARLGRAVRAPRARRDARRDAAALHHADVPGVLGRARERFAPVVDPDRGGVRAGGADEGADRRRVAGARDPDLLRLEPRTGPAARPPDSGRGAGVRCSWPGRGTGWSRTRRAASGSRRSSAARTSSGFRARWTTTAGRSTYYLARAAGDVRAVERVLARGAVVRGAGGRVEASQRPYRRRLAPHRFLVAWFVAYLAVFSAAATKLPNYIFPLYPALAILTARFLIAWRDRALATPRWVMAAGVGGDGARRRR